MDLLEEYEGDETDHDEDDEEDEDEDKGPPKMKEDKDADAEPPKENDIMAEHWTTAPARHKRSMAAGGEGPQWR